MCPDTGSAPHIIVYGRAACMPCRLTKKKFADAGVQFEYVDVDSSPDTLEGLTEEEWITALPVVVTNAQPELRWCGMQPEKIRYVTDHWGSPKE